jgi:hypothetical protein
MKKRKPSFNKAAKLQADSLKDHLFSLIEENDAARIADFLRAHPGAHSWPRTGDGALGLWVKVPLHIASRGGHFDAVKELVTAGADVNLRNPQGFTPLMLAVLSDRPDIAGYLIAKGADVDRRDDDGATPLSAAIYHGALKCAEILLEAGADANGSERDMPLHNAAYRDFDDTTPDAVKLLREHGANPGRRDKDGHTAREWAQMKGRQDVAACIDTYVRDLATRRDVDRLNGGSAVPFTVGKPLQFKLKLRMA